MGLKFIIPTIKPVGGVVKIFDYIIHAKELGLQYELYYRDEMDLSSMLFDNPRFSCLVNENYTKLSDLTFDFDVDYLFFTWPEDFKRFQLKVSPKSLHRVIHIVQNTRHASAYFCDGYALRLLSYPISRIFINDIVRNAVSPYLTSLNPFQQVINIAHNLDYFNKSKDNRMGRKIKIAYTTWKSDLGDRVRDLLVKDKRLKFRSINQYVGWSELRDLYHWADVFLATPNKEEGLYLPGLEAMSAGCRLIIPDCGGNMMYCRDGENCNLVDFDDELAYIKCIKEYINESNSEKNCYKTIGYETIIDYNVNDEKFGFLNFINSINEA